MCIGQRSPCPRCRHQRQRRRQLGCSFHLTAARPAAAVPAAVPPQQRPAATRVQRPQARARPLQRRPHYRLCGELPPPTAAVQWARCGACPAQLLGKHHRCHCQCSASLRCHCCQDHCLCCRLPVRLVSDHPHLRLAVHCWAPERHRVLQLHRPWTRLETGPPLDISSMACACHALGRALPAAIEAVQRLPASVSHVMQALIMSRHPSMSRHVQTALQLLAACVRTSACAGRTCQTCQAAGLWMHPIHRLALHQHRCCCCCRCCSMPCRDAAITLTTAMLCKLMERTTK